MKPMNHIMSLCCLGVPACSVSKAVLQADRDSHRFARAAALRGFIVVDGRGRVLSRSAGADDLLLVCARIGGEPASTDGSPDDRAPRAVMDLVGQLQRQGAGRRSVGQHDRATACGSRQPDPGEPDDGETDIGAAPLSRRTLTTAWGLLNIEAAWLEGTDDRAIAVHLELHEPASAYAARLLRGQGVPPVQMQVGVLLALGWTKPRVARALGVKPSSVIDAARKLYDRLGVHSASELATLLWAERSS